MNNMSLSARSADQMLTDAYGSRVALAEQAAIGREARERGVSSTRVGQEWQERWAAEQAADHGRVEALLKQYGTYERVLAAAAAAGCPPHALQPTSATRAPQAFNADAYRAAYQQQFGVVPDQYQIDGVRAQWESGDPRAAITALGQGQHGQPAGIQAQPSAGPPGSGRPLSPPRSW
jgi:hypothetical protein